MNLTPYFQSCFSNMSHLTQTSILIVINYFSDINLYTQCVYEYEANELVLLSPLKPKQQQETVLKILNSLGLKEFLGSEKLSATNLNFLMVDQHINYITVGFHGS